MIVDSPGPAPRAPLGDAVAVRRDVPLLRRQVHGKRIVDLDTASTTQKPQVFG